MFGSKPTFGGASTGFGGFGNTAQTSTFGATSSTNTFGAPATSAFGQPAASTGGLFGATNAQPQQAGKKSYRNSTVKYKRKSLFHIFISQCFVNKIT